MPNITEENYPVEDGWNHVEADLENFETIVGEQEGQIVKGAIRRKEAQAA